MHNNQGRLLLTCVIALDITTSISPLIRYLTFHPLSVIKSKLTGESTREINSVRGVDGTPLSKIDKYYFVQMCAGEFEHTPQDNLRI